MTLEPAEQAQSKVQDEMNLMTINVRGKEVDRITSSIAYKAFRSRLSYLRGVVDSKLGIEN